jgi:DNA repair protein RadC
MKKFKTKLPKLLLKYINTEFDKTKITCSKDSYDTLLQLFDHDTIEYQEEMILIALNRQNNVIGYHKLSKGSQAGTCIDIKVIASVLLLSGAQSTILAHNHPSGNIQPSEQDIKITRKIKEGLSLLDIKLLDHLIITKNNNYYSLVDNADFY